ncbi:Metallo-dependent phosphatase [Rickenella mellea]|uniref:Serine/threonine-protein phosphatase n=1 Tax=Rickenella mellea TaxID=50990 RepID=A0A4Y7PY87_9AGAM|nr:Metallo-dependent phosphatase [Rickenella mellea]
MPEANEEYLQSVVKHMLGKSTLPPNVSTEAVTSITQTRRMEGVRSFGRRVVPPPAFRKPTDEEFFMLDERDGQRKPNAQFLKQHFFQEGRLKEEQALYIIERATALLRDEPNMLEVVGDVTVVGDIHGQYYDFMKLLDIGGTVPENAYIFLGDYVDRGCFGIECLLYLYTLKIWYPQKVSMLRGNHECRHLTEYFTFQRECMRKYSVRIYEACVESFYALPIACLLDKRFLCIHGGLSPELVMLSDINNVNRFQEPPPHGLLCDILWSDPISNFGHEQEGPNGVGLPPGTSFVHNPTRGCSFFFTYEATCNFLERNNLLGIMRGHEAQAEGYTMYRKTPTKKFPSVITIFSAPNYCDAYHNRAAVLKYVNRNITIRQFNSNPHPYWLPNFMDAFTWSLPFVGSKIVEMLLAILSCCTEEELEEPSLSVSDEDMRAMEDEQQQAARKETEARIKAKILGIGRMARMLNIMREESEEASELHTMDVDGPDSDLQARGITAVERRIGPDALHVQGNRIRKSIRSFDDARRSDIDNERIPEFNEGASSSYPHLQAPSTRLRRANTSVDMETVMRRAIDTDDDETKQLAEMIARSDNRHGRPRALKRHETV